MEAQNGTVEERIRKIMDTSRMSQIDFSKLLDISPASLSSIFNGRTRATNNHTFAIHRAFPNININWLLFGEGQMYHNSPNGNDVIGDDDTAQPSLFTADEVQQRASMPYGPPKAAPYPPHDTTSFQTVGQEVKNFDIKKRAIKEIRVFYDDGTYESFSPQE